MHNCITNPLLRGVSKSVVRGHQDDHLQGADKKKKNENNDEHELHHCLSTLATGEFLVNVGSSCISFPHDLSLIQCTHLGVTRELARAAGIAHSRRLKWNIENSTRN
jgi:hypothetical protein